MPPPDKPAKNSPLTPLITAPTARAIAADLSVWFDEFQRELNFRATKDPYAVMVSEFMLQQTTVAAVEAYFARFMLKFPTVSSLANAAEDDVLAVWAGLGYYRRARQLHLAAKEIMARHAGQIPRDLVSLQALPGIGRYTAGAIASIAYNEPAPILEANSIRVYARLAGLIGTVGERAFLQDLWTVAENLVSEAVLPGKFNTAAMELGSIVCRPVPLCERCPVSTYCKAFQNGYANKTPVIAPARPSVAVAVVCLVVSNENNEYLVRRIPAGEWHAGMWEFPALRSPDEMTPIEATATTARYYGLALQSTEPLTTLRYQVTHHKISCHVFRATLKITGIRGFSQKETWQFLSLADISSLPMGSAQKKLLKVLSE